MNRRRPLQHAEALPNAPDMELVAGLITERESEYARISHFLHDEVGQVLSAVGFNWTLCGTTLALPRPNWTNAPTKSSRCSKPSSAGFAT